MNSTSSNSYRSVINSGRDVPIATILAPSNIGGAPKSTARSSPEVTTKRAETITPSKATSKSASTLTLLSYF